jgi:hypothetical protein
MKKLIAMVAAIGALSAAPVITADFAAAKSKAKSAESAPAPAPKASTNEGAASGEKGTSVGSGESTNAAWDQTYQSDIAQEKQLKAGGSK